MRNELPSNVAAKLLEDARIGIAPLEKSTRYVRFDHKDQNGEYLFCKENKIVTTADPKRKNFFSYKGVDIFKPNLKEVKDNREPFSYKNSLALLVAMYF